MSAELNARRTAAAAIAADFDREIDAYLARPPGTAAPDYSHWAFRMRAELRSLLEQLAAHADGGQAASHVRSDGSAVLSPADLVTVLNALGDGAASVDDVVACRALAYRLGDYRG